MTEESKTFFFAKKKQKTFVTWPVIAAPSQAKLQKFFASFFQKRALAGLLVSFPFAASAQIRAVQMQPPARDFGYFVGDLVVGTAVITVEPGTVLDTRSLPVAGPVTSSTDLRSVDVTEAAAAGGQAITVRAEYQTFSAPEEVSPVAIPGYQLVFMQGGARLTATVPGFSFASSPFRHDLTPIVDLAVLRPDRSAAAADLSQYWLEIAGGAGVAVLAVLVMVAVEGRAPWRRSRAPFALAARQIGRRAENGPADLLVLHRALDATAGERVLADDLERFLQRHSRFADLRRELHDFFVVSRESFFSDRTEASHPFKTRLTHLARSLARAERRR